jgi:tetratricopeptide (TPR) repeat protein
MNSRLASVIAIVALGAAIGCARSAPSRPSACTDAGVPVNPVLLAFLSRARDAHHVADEYEENKDLPSAIAQLQKVVEGPVPGSGAPPPEAREVLADTWARLADLESRLGRFDAAEADVAKGLKLVPSVSYFRGHLFEVRGLTEQRRARAFHADKNESGAGAAKQRALDAFEESMRIQAKVIQTTIPAKSADGG